MATKISALTAASAVNITDAATGFPFVDSTVTTVRVSIAQLRTQLLTAPYAGAIGVTGATGFLTVDDQAGGGNPTWKQYASGGVFRVYNTLDGDCLKVTRSVVAGDTRLQVYDVTAAALVTVTRGIADSGGVGFRLLRVPN